MNFLRLQKEKLDIAAISDLVADESCGAISFFVGTTRDNFEDKKVITLEYEAFEPMAVKQMNAICEDLRAKWPDLKNIAIYHRLGLVPVKETSIIIAISAPHRENSLLAVKSAIDQLKTSVPIFKKEKYDGDESTWKENKEFPLTNSARRIKRSKFNFDSCPVDAAPIPKNLIQINANETEVSRRIHRFVEKKREEIDVENISCFTEKTVEEAVAEEDSCARVNGTVFKQKDSNGHLRVRRVKNEVGPQIKPDYASQLNRLMTNISRSSNVKKEPVDHDQDQDSLPQGLEERLENIEKFLGNDSRPVPRDMYKRVKNIEDRLIYLETISPEYYHFVGEKPPDDVGKKRDKPYFTIEDIDRFIHDIENTM